jgi:PAS domain S-box-containing protein
VTSHFEELFECSPVAMLLVSGTGKIVLVNRYAERLFQYGRAELIGADIELLVPEAVRGRHPALVQDYVGAPLPRQMGKGRNLFAVKKDHSQFPVEVGLNPIDMEGQVMVLSSVIDITERQRAEERFRAAVEAAPNGMLMIDSDRKIVLCNKEIEKIFGYARDELAGQAIEILVPEDFRGPHPTFVSNYFGKPQPRAMGIGRELFGRHKSGRLIPVEIGLQPVIAAGAAIVISSVVDITHRRNAEVEIQRKTEEIEEFSYRTSHDLRSPLKSIAGMAECVAEHLADKNYDQAHDGVGKISHLAAKLLTLVEDLLALTRVDVADEPLVPFDFTEYAATAAEKFQAMLVESGVQLDFTFLHRHPLVVQNARLTQVVDNLIGNGIKYSDPAKPSRTVSVQTFDSADRFFLRVADNGTGIPQQRQAEVFEMFKRFHAPSIPGSGLGLHIVKKQVKKLGATIEFDSSPDGTTFYLKLPLEKSSLGSS